MGGRVWQSLFLTLALALRAVRQTEVKKQVSSLRLDIVQTKTTLTAEDAIVRINQRIFRYEKPWRSFLIEGDIIKPLWKNAVVSESKTWHKSPDGVVRIPYEISQKYDEETRSSISRGFKDFEKFTCVRFVPHSDEEDFISIQPIHGCYSSVGRIGGMQLISLNHRCLKKGKGVVEHEIMHSLGFWHEHARSDRDKYIKIEWKNVWPGYEHNFLKQNTNNLKTKYDYGSILHYSRTAFSKNRKPTLRPLMDTDTVLGQRIRLSELDLVKVNRLYNCTTHLKDKANVVKRLQMLNEDGSLHELGRTKEAGRLKYLLGIYPETVKVRIDTSAQLIWSLSGNGSTGNHTATNAHGYRECFRRGTCSPTSWPTKSGPAFIRNASVIAAVKAPEASGGQVELSVAAQDQKQKAETLFPTRTELPFAQSLSTNLKTTHSLLHIMSPALTRRTLTQPPAPCPKACTRRMSKAPILHQQSQNSFGQIELLPVTPHILKSGNQSHGSLLPPADSLTTRRQGPQPISWSDEPDTHTQAANIVQQSSSASGFPPILINAIYPKRFAILCQSCKHRHERLPILSPVFQTQLTGHLEIMTPANQFKVPTVQSTIPATGTTIAPGILRTDVGESPHVPIDMASQKKAPAVTLHTKGLASHLKIDSLARWNKALKLCDPLVTTRPALTHILLTPTSPTEMLLLSTSLVKSLLASAALVNFRVEPPRSMDVLLEPVHPTENVLKSTPLADTQLSSTPLVGTLLAPTGPANTLLASTPHADNLLASTPPAQTLLDGTLPGETLLASTPPENSLLATIPHADTLLASTAHVDTPLSSVEPLLAPTLIADTLLPSTSPVETVQASTPPADIPRASTPTADTPRASTPPADTPRASRPPADTLRASTPPADTPRASIPAADTPQVSTPAVDTPQASTPPVDTPRASTPTADTHRASTPPADTPQASTPPVDTPQASTPTADTPRASTLTLTADTPRASTPTADTPRASTPPADTPRDSRPPADTLRASTPPADTPRASTPPADTPRASRPPADTLRASTPPADTLRASTPPADTPWASTPTADTPRVSTPPADTPRASTPPVDTPRASTPTADTPRASTPPADTPQASTPPMDTPQASTLPVDTPRASTPTADTPRASTPTADTPRASTPPADTPRDSRPPADTLRASTPPADTPRASTPPADTPRASTPPADTPRASIPAADTPQASTPPVDTPQASTPPVDTPRGSTPPADTPRASRPPADTPQASIPAADTPRAYTPPADTPQDSTPPVDTLRTSTPPADTPRASGPPVDTPRASTPPADIPRASSPRVDTLWTSTPPTDTPQASTPPADTPWASTQPADTPQASTPPAHTLRASTPPIDTLWASTPPADTLRASTLPADISQAFIPPADTPRASTLPADISQAFIPPADTPRASTPPADTPRASTTLASTLRVTTPPADTVQVTTPHADTLQVTTPPADTPQITTPPEDTLLVTTPPADTPRATTPPASTLQALTHPADTPQASTPPADTVQVTTPPADTLQALTHHAEILLPAEALLSSTHIADTLLTSTSLAIINAGDPQSIISPFTVTRWYSPVVTNPLYDANLISPSQSVLPADLAVELLCDFEHGPCDWGQSTTDAFDWMLHHHQTSSRGTGPKWDHTRGQCKGRGGHYLYLEASYPRQSGEQAALISPLLRGQKCLTFWFNMFGRHMGSLNVFLKYENAPHWHKLWSVSGNQGRKWLNAEIDIFPNGETYRVIIEGVLGPNYQSDAAIDDVQIHRSRCTSGWERRNPSCNWGRKKKNKSHLG